MDIRKVRHGEPADRAGGQVACYFDEGDSDFEA